MKRLSHGIKVRPYRRKPGWVMLSLMVHLLVLSTLMLFDGTPFGRGGVGLGGSGSLQLSWVPGQAGGGGKGGDTAVADDDDGNAVGVVNGTEVQTEPSNQTLVAVTQTEPDQVFNQPSDPTSVVDQETPSTGTIRKTSMTASDAHVTDLPTDVATTNPRGGQSARVGAAGNGDGQGTGQGEGDGTGNGGTGGNQNGTRFFGIFTRAKRIVYVIDASESMLQHNAMEVARQNLLSSLSELTPGSQFQIVFFNIVNHSMTREGEKFKLLPATSVNLRQAKRFLTGIQPEAGTDRYSAVTYALTLQPDIIFLLTDADEPAMSAKELYEIQRSNKRKTSVHVVEFGVGADLRSDSFLKKLTRQNNGEHFYHDLTRDQRD